MKTTVLLSVVCFSLAIASMSGQQPSGGDAAARSRFVDPLSLLQGRALHLQPARENAVPAPAAGTKTYNFLTVDYPGAAYSFVLGSNGKTDVGGFQFDPSSSAGQPFVHTAAKYTTILIPGAKSAWLAGINSIGVMCGGYLDDSNVVHGFTYAGGIAAPFDPPGSVYTSVRDINDAGDLAGTYVDDSGTHGFVRIGGVFTTVNFPGDFGAYMSGINNLGQAVGLWLDSGYYPHGFVWSNGVFTNLDFPGALGTTARGINDAGKIVGDTFDANSGHGFLYDGGFKTIDIVGAKFTVPEHIDNLGHITGSYVDALNEYHGFKGH
jgi:probable HAF family extracellular repeat protein